MDLHIDIRARYNDGRIEYRGIVRDGEEQLYVSEWYRRRDLAVDQAQRRAAILYDRSRARGKNRQRIIEPRWPMDNH